MTQYDDVEDEEPDEQSEADNIHEECHDEEPCYFEEDLPDSVLYGTDNE